MSYRSVLNTRLCERCNLRNICFLRTMPLQNYPTSSQLFVKQVPSNAYYLDAENHWHGNYATIQDYLISYYNSCGGYIQDNISPVLSPKGQHDSDVELIRRVFKQLLTIASEETRDSNPMASIMFDGIGIVLASDYLEVVHKVFSMISTTVKMVENYDCGYFNSIR